MFAASRALSISLRHLAPRLMSVELANPLTSSACSRPRLRAYATAAAAVTWLMKTLLIGIVSPGCAVPIRRVDAISTSDSFLAGVSSFAVRLGR